MKGPDTLFLQIHTLTSYPGVLLNRDDAGFAKRLPFGGATRTRISSQCLKRHWRTFEGSHALSELDAPRSLRSRYTFEVRVARPLAEEGFPVLLVKDVAARVMSTVLGSKSDMSGDGPLKTGQITVLGEPEVEYLASFTKEVMEKLEEEHDAIYEKYARSSTDEASELELTKDEKSNLDSFLKKYVEKGDAKKNLAGLGLAAGLDAALFGRMVTSDLLSRGDAAVHVAHAITVHEEESESDYFSALDDLLGELSGGDEEQRGSGHINSSELNSGLFYSYVVVDVPLLVSNLTGCAREDWREQDLQLARDVLERLVHIIATVSPGAKRGSTAPYSHAQCVLLEAGQMQPRTMANAFQRPVPTRGDLCANAYAALASFWKDHAQMYGVNNEVRLSAMGSAAVLEDALGVKRVPLSENASWLAEQLGRE